MKSIFYWIMLIPFLVFSQTEQKSSEEYLVIKTTVFSAKSDKTKEFSEGMKNHNDQFHSGGIKGVRIFNIMNGPNANDLMAVMGPMPWSALDQPMQNQDAHDEDWTTNVLPYMENERDMAFWRFHNNYSNFPPNFEMNKLKVSVWDMKRGEKDGMKNGLEKISKVLKEKMSGMPFGIYTNEFSSTKEGRDLSMVYFFDDFSWLGIDQKIKDKYNEVNGAGSFETFLNEWRTITNGFTQELWVYNQELSGIGPQVTTDTN